MTSSQAASTALLVAASLLACGARSPLEGGSVERSPEAVGGASTTSPVPSDPQPNGGAPPVDNPDPPRPDPPQPDPPKPVDPCLPNCEARACGADDGCGNICVDGECSEGSSCMAGKCGCDAKTCAGECVDDACWLGPRSIVLFGGSTSWGGYTDATWVFDQRGWTAQKVSSPFPRSAGAMALLGDKNVLFGGIGKVDTQTPADGLDDTHEWDGRAWTSRAVSGPSPRWSHRMATLNGKVVLFGGYNRVDQYLSETWEWDGAAWAKYLGAGPPGRVAHAMATVGDRVLLFGGQGEQGNLGDTWTWDGHVWTELHVSPSPSARAGHAMAGGPSRAVLLGSGSPADTWEWDGKSWKEHLVPGPSRRSSAGMARWGTNVVLFGGLRVVNNDYQFLSDTWQWDGQSWRDLDLPGPKGVASPFMSER